MKVYTIGDGFVTAHLPYQQIKIRVLPDICQIYSILDTFKPDVIINCIGKTGRPNIDWCEDNKEITSLTNTAIPILLAEACAKKSIHLIQIGSGCIYFGESPNFHYLQADGSPMPDVGSQTSAFTVTMPCQKINDGWKENDFANPKSFYSKSKYACDLAIGDMKHVAVLRIRMPISTKNNSRNLINKLRGYKEIINIPNSVTFMDDLVRCIDWTITNSRTGIFHVTNPEPLTAFKIMKEYQKYMPEHTFSLIDEKRLDQLTIAKRSNCIINSDKLRNAGFSMTPSEEALKNCMAEYIKNI